MSIQKFYNQAAQRDFARVFQFRVSQFGNVNFNDNHLVYVETATLPGRTITNVPVTYMGLDFNIPGTVKYPGSAGYSVVFRCDQNYDIRAALEAATFASFNENTSTGDYNTPSPGSLLVLELLDKGGDNVQKVAPRVVRTYVLVGAYVQSIADAGYDIKDTGTIQTVTTSIAYQYWYSYAGARISQPRLGPNQFGGAGVQVTPNNPWGSRR